MRVHRGSPCGGRIDLSFWRVPARHRPLRTQRGRRRRARRADGLRPARASRRQRRRRDRPRPHDRRGVGRAHRVRGDAVDGGQVGKTGARRQRRGADLSSRPSAAAASVSARRSRRRSRPKFADPTRRRRSSRLTLQGAPAIAVLPFERLGDREAQAGLEEALPHEVILALARLRSLFVIARGSSFRFRSPGVDLGELGRVLGARYAVLGHGRGLRAAHRRRGRTRRDRRAGPFCGGSATRGTLDDVPGLRGTIVRGVCSALDVQISLAEARLAQGRTVENLDAWQAFHLGLRHVNQYTSAGNEAAGALFAPGRRDRSLLRPRPCRPFLRPFPERLPPLPSRPGRRDRRGGGGRRGGGRARPA